VSSIAKKVDWKNSILKIEIIKQEILGLKKQEGKAFWWAVRH
jgi:hypothetical protein